MTASIIITTFNDSEYLKQAIDSVLAGTLLPEEIIVVDDGSTSCNAERVATSYFDASPRITYHRQANNGPSSARNSGIELATQQHVAFLDVDDAWLPENLAQKSALLQDCGSEYFGVYGSFVDGKSRKTGRFRDWDGLPPAEKIGAARGIPGGAPSYLFRRSALVSVGGFDVRLHLNEDFDLILRLGAEGWLVKGNSVPGFVRNIRPGSLTRSSDPHLRHSRVSLFLDKAEAQGYLPDAEIRRRRKLNSLALASFLKRHGGARTEILSALEAAFHHGPPRTTAEFGAFGYMKLLSLGAGR